MENPTLVSDWLTLGEASQLLGVHPATLRTWVDAGLVRAFRTPGGHRRFQLDELRSFLEHRRSSPATRALIVAPDKTLQQVRRQLSAEPVARAQWYQRLTDDQRARQRALGQRLLGLLLQFVGREESAEHFLAEGCALARLYGRDLAQAGFSVTEVAQVFLFFRRAIVNSAYHPKGGSAQGDAEGARLLQRITLFMDELLLATLDAYAQAASGAQPPKTRRRVKNLPKSTTRTAGSDKK